MNEHVEEQKKMIRQDPTYQSKHLLLMGVALFMLFANAFLVVQKKKADEAHKNAIAELEERVNGLAKELEACREK